MDDALRARLSLALEAAAQAGRVTLRYFLRPDLQELERKADDSPVTRADREAEQQLRSLIRQAFPDDAIIGEEFGPSQGDSGYRWILDPIDGTKSFMHGVPLYGTLVGVEHAGQGVIGVIHMPALDETVYAARGGGAFWVQGGKPPVAARVSTRQDLRESLLVTSQIDSFGRRGADDAFRRLEQQAGVTRTWGDCYGYLLVATGRAALMIDPMMHVWDAAAVQPVVEEAGGFFTDWSGRPTIHGGEGLAACSAAVLDLALREIGRESPR